MRTVACSTAADAWAYSADMWQAGRGDGALASDGTQYLYPVEGGSVQIADEGRAMPRLSDFGGDLTAAIAHCQTTGQPLYIPPGTWIYSDPVVITGGIEIYGAGEQSTLAFTGTGRALSVIGAKMWALRRFQIKSATTSTGLYIEDAYHGTIEQVVIDGNLERGCTFAGVEIRKSAGGLSTQLLAMDNCRVQSCKGHGLVVGQNCGLISLRGTRITANVGIGLYCPLDEIDAWSWFHAIGSCVEGNYGGQVVADRLNGARFDNCHFENGLGVTYPIMRLGLGAMCKRVAVVNCNLSAGAADYALHVAACQDLIVQGCALSLTNLDAPAYLFLDTVLGGLIGPNDTLQDIPHILEGVRVEGVMVV